jgi:hypothetical protein
MHPTAPSGNGRIIWMIGRVKQLARWAGTSEATIKRHYLEVLTAESGQEWFKVKYVTEIVQNITDKIEALVATRSQSLSGRPGITPNVRDLVPPH